MSETHSSSTVPIRDPPSLCPILQDEDYDAWVLAGGRLFRAHSSVLAAHSTYLRGAAVGATVGAGSSDRDVRLLLPHVPSAGFAAVLTYMYTGRLPLTPSTLYEVLLAGHLLQMAGVVSLCQALLTTTAATTTVAVPPPLSVWRGLARLVPPHHHATATTTTTTIVRPTPTRPRPHHHHHHHPLQELTLEPVDGGGSRSLSLAPCPDENTAPEGGGDSRYGGDGETAAGGGGVGAAAAAAVVIDVAACDGPVFFERVINRAYRANPLLGADDSETETEINVDDIDSCDDDSSRQVATATTQELPLGAAAGGNGIAGLLRLQAASGTQRNGPVSPPTPASVTSRTYHCVYCNHTFKSHYCYQKHMRRHINPITVEVDKLRGAAVVACTTGGGQEGGCRFTRSATQEGGSSNSASNDSGKSRSGSPYSSRHLSPAPSEGLKILDLNVQYFPCKTCGCKFPSYYFVHKHRRLCHQEEEATSFAKKTTNNPPATPSTSTSTTSTPSTTPVNTPTTTPA
ncbi:B-cell CLL/lymphoma 6 member B protein [Cherax quadricarinatus]|uniref:B-cell CLL/lymphoma 6 member B protein n=1 Tax=Cherax quadricarinatus TaxID=27406 RepID=UPI00387EE04B